MTIQHSLPATLKALTTALLLGETNANSFSPIRASVMPSLPRVHRDTLAVNGDLKTPSRRQLLDNSPKEPMNSDQFTARNNADSMEFAEELRILCLKSTHALGATEQQINHEISEKKEQYLGEQCKDFELVKSREPETRFRNWGTQQKLIERQAKVKCVDAVNDIIHAESECETQTILSASPALKSAFNEAKAQFLDSVKNFERQAVATLDDSLREYNYEKTKDTAQFVKKLTSILDGLKEGIGIPLDEYGFEGICSWDSAYKNDKKVAYHTVQERFCILPESPLDHFIKSLDGQPANDPSTSDKSLLILTHRDMQRIGISEFRRATTPFTLRLKSLIDEMNINIEREALSHQQQPSKTPLAKVQYKLDAVVKRTNVKPAPSSAIPLIPGLLLACGAGLLGILLGILIRSKPPEPDSGNNENLSDVPASDESRTLLASLNEATPAGAQSTVIEMETFLAQTAPETEGQVG